MQTTPKANKTVRQFFALLAGGATLAIATLVIASTSKQVEDLSSLVVPRTGHAATALSDGKVLITGGHDSAGNLVAVSEIFDPTTKTSTASATLITARVDHTATRLADGRVLVAGGTGASGALSSAEVFDPANPGFHAVGSAMTAARSGHTATLLNNGSVLIAGGDATGTAEIFNPTTQTFSPTLWNLTVARSGHTATLFTDDSVLLAGGNSDSLELFTPADEKFTVDTATMSAVRTGHWAFELSDTRLLLFQGDTANSIDEYNPTTDTITSKGSLDFHASSSTLLANGKVLVLSTGVAGLYDPDAVPPAPDFTAFDETSVPGSGILPRSGQSAVELSGDKKILVAGGKNVQNLFQGAALFNPARVWTDKDDYAPDDPVILSGSGWKASEGVQLYAVDNATEQWTYGSTVAADTNGGFVVSPFFIVELRHLGVQFHVTALGAQSAMQADVQFTDAGNFGYSPSTPQTLAIAPGSSNSTLIQSVTDPKNNDALTAARVVTGTGGNPLPASWVSTSPASLSFGSTSGSNPAQTLPWTVTVTVPALTTPGAYTGNIKAHATGSGATPNDGPGTDLTINVTAPPAITSANNTTFTVNTAGSFNVTATGFPAPTFTKTGALPSGVNLSSAGVLSGTPALGTVGDYPITITASNGVLPNATQAFTLHVVQATATVTIQASSLTQTYNGNPRTVNVNTTPSGLSVSVTYNGSSTAPTNAGSYAVVATITDPNYTSPPATGTLVVSPTNANPTITVTPYHVTEDGNPHTATGTATGVGGENVSASLNLSGTTHTAAGDYPADPWTFSNPNYSATPSGTVHDIIDSACTSPSVTTQPSQVPPTYTYGGGNVTFTAHASGSPAPTVQWEVSTNGGVSFLPLSNGGNISGATTDTLTISNPTVAMSGNKYHAVFTNSCTPATATSNAATLTVNQKTLTASIVNDPTRPYNGNTDATLTSANFQLSGLVGTDNFTVTQTAGTYNSKDVATAATVTATLSASDFTPTGSTLASNYNLPTTASGPGHITKVTLTASIILNPTRPYNGNTTATLTSANFSLSPLVGSENFTVTQTSGTYNSKDVADADTVSASLAPANFTPTGGADSGNYTLPTTASGPGHITPVTLTASIIGNPTRPYNCGLAATLAPANFSLSGLVSPENFTVTQTVGAYNSKDVVAAISVSATLASGDFTGTNGGIATNYVLPTSASGLGHITPVNASSITVTPYTAPTTVYNCTNHTATGSATGCDGDLSALLDLSGTTHKDAGTYNGDSWTFNAGSANPNYNSASGTVNDSIARANATIDITPYTSPTTVYNCNSHTATGTATGCDGNLLLLGDTLDLSGTTHTNAGDYPTDAWTFTDVTGNYNSTSGTVHDSIAKANTTASVSSTPNPSIVAQPVTFTATVAGNPAVTCVPTGTVTFKDGAATLGTGTLNASGQATFTTSLLSAGSHPITAVYGSDSNFNGSTGPSPAYVQSVQFIFIGFLPPIDNLPIVNSSKAGQTIPIKWQLKDFNGNLISDLGTLAPNGLTSGQVACGSAPQDVIEELSAPGGTVFRWDGTQFIYNWQTSKPWNGTCRLLQVKLSDGTSHYANFTFK